MEASGPCPGAQDVGVGHRPFEGGGTVQRGAGGLQPGPLSPDTHVLQAEGRP